MKYEKCKTYKKNQEMRKKHKKAVKTCEIKES